MYVQTSYHLSRHRYHTSARLPVCPASNQVERESANAKSHSPRATNRSTLARGLDCSTLFIVLSVGCRLSVCARPTSPRTLSLSCLISFYTIFSHILTCLYHTPLSLTSWSYPCSIVSIVSICALSTRELGHRSCAGQGYSLVRRRDVWIYATSLQVVSSQYAVDLLQAK